MKKYIEIRAENQRRVFITKYLIENEQPTQEDITNMINNAVTDFYLSQNTYTRLVHIKVHLNENKEFIAYEKKYKR